MIVILNNKCNLSKTEFIKYQEELKTINCFDGIVLMPRTMPFKTTFLPDYKIEYSFSNKTCNMPKRNINSLKIYKEK